MKLFVQQIMTANDKGVNLAKLNQLIEKEIRKHNETILSLNNNSDTDATIKAAPNNNNNNGLSNSNSSIPSYAKSAIETVVRITEQQQYYDIKSTSNADVESKIPKSKTQKNTIYKIVTNGNIINNKNEDKRMVITFDASTWVPTEMSNWEFISSLNYVTTLVTTIGYGHVSPVTSEGKILTLVFGAVAIPCTLLFFSILISTIRDGPVKAFEIWLIQHVSRFRQHYQITLLKIRFLHLMLVTLILFIALILIPAVMFVQLEPDWTFLDSFYYCFITITTVGLGDYVPAQNTLTYSGSRPFYLLGKYSL